MQGTENLRKQHRDILQIVGEMSPFLDNGEALSQNVVNARLILSKLIGKLNLHFAMENKSLYPKLISSKNSQLSTLAQDFAEEIVGMKEELETYNQSWITVESIENDPYSFIKATKKFFMALRNRIHREESELYSLVDH